jgi:hypothetical protein
MWKRVSFSAAVMALMWALAPPVEAALITGSMSISGGLVPVNASTGAMAPLATATGLDFVMSGTSLTPGVPGDFSVDAASGDFAGLVGVNNGQIQDFAFAGGVPLASYPNVPVGSFEAIGAGFSFDLSTISVLTQVPDILTLIGTGTFHLTGFDPTPGSFIFSANSAEPTFSFSASQRAIGENTPIPEPGSMLLLGTGLIGLAGVARRRWTARATE